MLVYRLGASPRSATSALPVTSTQSTASPRGPGIPITKENTRDGAAPAGGRNIRDRICEGRCQEVQGQVRGKVAERSRSTDEGDCACARNGTIAGGDPTK